MNRTFAMFSVVASAVAATLLSANAANTWSGSFDSDFNTATNYVENSWSQWTDYIFDANAVNPAMNVDEFVGWGNITLNSGLTTNIVIEGSQPIVMAPAKVGVWIEPSLGGTVTIDTAGKDLTVNTGFLISGELVWDIGAGRTLTANGAVNVWSGQGSAASLNKQGAGTAVLAGANNYDGTTDINGGTLVVANSAALGVGGWSGTSWTLLSSGATLALQGNISLDEHMHLDGAGVDGLGALRSLSGNNALTMTHANGGSGPGFALDGDTTVGVDADTLTVGGFYQDGGSFGISKRGNGTLVLIQTNTYTGATTVNAGTLKLSGARLLTDNFTATGTPNTMDLNYSLANRQAGSPATQSWTGSGNVQVGNATGVGQPVGTGGDYLLLAFGASAKLGGLALSAGNVGGPLKISFDMFKGNVVDTTQWTSFTLTSDGDGWPVVGSGEIGFLYRKNTGVQVFNNGSAIADFSSTSGGDSFAFYLTDSAGTGSPFAASGTRVIITQGGSLLGTYALDTGMGTSYLAFRTADGGGDNAMIGGIDNITIKNVKTNVLDASTAVSLTASGTAMELDLEIQTVASLSGVSGSRVNMGPLSKLTVDGTDNTTFAGVIAGVMAELAKNGSGTLSLSGTNTYTGATTVSGGTLRIDGDSSGATGALTVESGAFLGGNGSYGGSITLNAGAALNCALNLSGSTLTCGGQLNFTDLDFADCAFTVAPGAGYPPHRSFTLIEAASLGTATFANAAGRIDGVPARLSVSGNTLMLSVGYSGTVITIL